MFRLTLCLIAVAAIKHNVFKKKMNEKGNTQLVEQTFTEKYIQGNFDNFVTYQRD